MNRLGLKVVCIISLTILIILVPIGLAQLPNETANMLSRVGLMPRQEPRQVMPMPMPPHHLIPMIVGNGFALAEAFAENGDFHVVNINVMGIRIIPVQNIRSMIAEGKNLSEIKEALVRAENATPVWKGYLKFGNTTYALNVTEFDGNHLNSDILWYPRIKIEANNNGIAEVKPIPAGNLSIDIKQYEGTIVGTGKIVLYPENGEGDKQAYDVYLYVSPDRPYIEPILKPIITSSAMDNEQKGLNALYSTPFRLAHYPNPLNPQGENAELDTYCCY